MERFLIDFVCIEVNRTKLRINVTSIWSKSVSLTCTMYCKHGQDSLMLYFTFPDNFLCIRKALRILVWVKLKVNLVLLFGNGYP